MADEGGVAEHGGNWLTAKAGPLPRWGWLAAGVAAGGLYLLLKKRGSTPQATASNMPTSAGVPWPTIAGTGSGGGTGTSTGSQSPVDISGLMAQLEQWWLSLQPTQPSPPASSPTPIASPVGPAQAPQLPSWLLQQQQEAMSQPGNLLAPYYNSIGQAAFNAESSAQQLANAAAFNAQQAGVPTPIAAPATTTGNANAINPGSGVQTPTAAPPTGQRLVQYVGGPLNGQWLPG